MALPVSGFPNVNAFAAEYHDEECDDPENEPNVPRKVAVNKRYLSLIDFAKSGSIATLMNVVLVMTIGFFVGVQLGF